MSPEPPLSSLPGGSQPGEPAAGGAAGAEPTRGWCEREVEEELPGLRLMHLRATVAHTGRGSPPAVKARLRELSNRWAGPHAVNLRQRAVPAAYRVFYRHIGLDPDVVRTPIEEAMLARMFQGGFHSNHLLADALLIALVDTGVPVWALDAVALDGPLGIRASREGEGLGGPPTHSSAHSPTVPPQACLPVPPAHPQAPPARPLARPQAPQAHSPAGPHAGLPAHPTSEVPPTRPSCPLGSWWSPTRTPRWRCCLGRSPPATSPRPAPATWSSSLCRSPGSLHCTSRRRCGCATRCLRGRGRGRSALTWARCARCAWAAPTHSRGRSPLPHKRQRAQWSYSSSTGGS